MQLTPTTRSLASTPAPLAPVRVIRVADLMVEDRGWTRGHATCAFDDYPRTAPGFLELGILRLAVLQIVDPGGGYPMHPHQEIETVTIPLSGALAHEDSMTGHDVTGSEDVAVLSAGTGMQHAEMVHGEAPARVVMFMMRTETLGLPPQFTKRMFARGDRKNRLVALASGEPTEGALPLRNRATILSAMLDAQATVTHAIGEHRCGYVMATDGAIEVNGCVAEAGDRVIVESCGAVVIRARAATEVVMVELPA